MTIVQVFIEQRGSGSAVAAILSNKGIPENWPPSAVGELLSRLAVEIAETEQARRIHEMNAKAGGGIMRERVLAASPLRDEVLRIMTGAVTSAYNDANVRTSEDTAKCILFALEELGFAVVRHDPDACPHCGADNVGNCRMPKCLWTN